MVFFISLILICYLIFVSYSIYINEFDAALEYIWVPFIACIVLFVMVWYRLIKKLMQRKQ
jgi:hypothetical protein